MSGESSRMARDVTLTAVVQTELDNVIRKDIAAMN
jgi:hypothetical protein